MWRDRSRRGKSLSRMRIRIPAPADQADRAVALNRATAGSRQRSVVGNGQLCQRRRLGGTQRRKVARCRPCPELLTRLGLVSTQRRPGMTDILGVDIGLHGALAVVRIINSMPTFLAMTDMPAVGSGARTRIDVHAVAAFLRQYPPSQAVLEHTQAFPGQGRSSIFSFGRSTGTLE